MEKILTQLQSMLERLIVLHDQLLSSAQAMNDAVRRNEIDAIQKCTAHYDETTVHIEELEEKRLGLCEELSRHMKPAARRVTMRDIISLAPPAQSEQFARRHNALKEKISALTRINTANKVLLQQNLETVTFNVELRFSAAKQSGGYGRTGTKDSAKRPQSMVNHTA